MVITGASPHLFFRGLGPNVVKHEECISQDPGCSKGPCPLTLHFFFMDRSLRFACRALHIWQRILKHRNASKRRHRRCCRSRIYWRPLETNFKSIENPWWLENPRLGTRLWRLWRLGHRKMGPVDGAPFSCAIAITPDHVSQKRCRLYII